MEVSTSNGGCGRALAKEVANCFLFKFAVRASAGVYFVNGMEVFVQGAMTCNEVHCSPVLLSVVYKRCVQLLLDFMVIVAKSRLSVSLAL